MGVSGRDGRGRLSKTTTYKRRCLCLRTPNRSSPWLPALLPAAGRHPSPAPRPRRRAACGGVCETQSVLARRQPPCRRQGRRRRLPTQPSRTQSKQLGRRDLSDTAVQGRRQTGRNYFSGCCLTPTRLCSWPGGAPRAAAARCRKLSTAHTASCRRKRPGEAHTTVRRRHRGSVVRDSKRSECSVYYVVLHPICSCRA